MEETRSLPEGGADKSERALVVGHSPIPVPVRLGNVIHIDTAGWRPAEGYFTLLNLETLEPVP